MKRPETAEEWAPYGIGEPDAEGWYPDYRTPPDLKPEAPKAEAAGQAAGRNIWWSDILPHWDRVVCDMAARYGIDLYDPAVLARPWPGVRTMIFGLINGDGQLARALRR